MLPFTKLHGSLKELLMILSPKVEGNRPRLACEIAAGGVVAARSSEPGGPLTAVARVELAEGAIVPSLRPGNVADRVATIAAVRRALEGIGARSNARNADLTLVIPDGAVRVLLLDFDSLPGKITEALPIVRFRLKKLVPFDTDEAMVSYQVMSSTRSAVRLLAVAIPRDVLSDYETVAREAGFEPGAVLPSTLAAVAALPASESGALVVNVYPSAVTTAITRGGVLLLHRTVELTESAAATPADLPSELFEPSAGANGSGSVGMAAMSETPASSDLTAMGFQERPLLPLVSVDDTAEEWAAQEPVPEFGRNPYADAISAESAVESGYGVTGVPIGLSAGITSAGSERTSDAEKLIGTESWNSLAEPNDASEPGRFGEAAPMSRSPYASSTVTDDLQTEIHNSFLTSAPPANAFQDGFVGDARRGLEEADDLNGLDGFIELEGDGLEGGLRGNDMQGGGVRVGEGSELPVHSLAPDVQSEEIARAVSVAVAYFEDLLSAAPDVLLSAGPLGAEGLQRTLEEQGAAAELGVRSRELVDSAALAAEATTVAVPRCLLAGVMGALRS